MNRPILLLVLFAVSFANPFLEADEKETVSSTTEQQPLDDVSARRIIIQFTSPQSPKMSHEDRCLLARAYNELGENKKAFEALNPVPEEYLAANHKLGAKRIYYHNLVHNVEKSEYFVGYLAFVQRCIDKDYPGKRIWLLWKASILCRTSVRRTSDAKDEIPAFKIVDYNQYEQAYETLKQGLAVPSSKSDDIDIFGPLFPIEPMANHFPRMHKEPRFKRLLGI